MPVPPDPDYFDKVNFVTDAWTQACEAPWYIYVSTLKPALLAAFITLLTFGWDDVLRGYARPPDRHSRRRSGKRGKGKRRGVRGIPEMGEAMGRHLPGSTAVKGIKRRSRRNSVGGTTGLPRRTCWQSTRTRCPSGPQSRLPRARVFTLGTCCSKRCAAVSIGSPMKLDGGGFPWQQPKTYPTAWTP